MGVIISWCKIRRKAPILLLKMKSKLPIPFKTIAPATKSLISNSGTWKPVCVVTWFVNTLNLGTSAFAVEPPSLPKSLYLSLINTQKSQDKLHVFYNCLCNWQCKLLIAHQQYKKPLRWNINMFIWTSQKCWSWSKKFIFEILLRWNLKLKRVHFKPYAK